MIGRLTAVETQHRVGDGNAAGALVVHAKADGSQSRRSVPGTTPQIRDPFSTFPFAMITFYRRRDDPWADEIQEALDEMVIAYETEWVEDEAPLPEDVPGLPALRDDEAVITGKVALREHLDHLRTLMADWDRFQSDACYVDADGSVC